MDAEPQHALVPEKFWRELAHSTEKLLILDYDGTLAPFTPDRGNALPYPQVRLALGEIAAAGNTRLVVVSGRPAHEVLRLLAILPAPEIWGSHGQEHLHGDQFEQALLDRQQIDLLRRARALALQHAPAGAVESKHGCVAVHWRGLPQQQQQHLQGKIRAEWEALQPESLQLRAFDGGLELRSAQFHKGTVLNELIRCTGSPNCIAYLGDDLTDEDAFAALKGRGLTVLVRSEYRPTLAEVWLRPPEEVVRFLVAWHEAASHSRRI